jgi:hypothetical protein
LDKSNRTEKFSAAGRVRHAGISAPIDSEHIIAHDKIMNLDGEVVITGEL